MPLNKFTTTDRSIRAVLLKELLELKLSHPETAIVTEFPLLNGWSRVDVAVINGILHGYELKSDLDSLFRLKYQIDSYNLVFDKVTLVVGKKHVVEALDLVPSWWGITVAKNYDKSDTPTLLEIRSAKGNPKQSVLAVINLLWKSELLQILEEINSIYKMRHKSKELICKELVQSLDEQDIKIHVKRKLLERRLKVIPSIDVT